MGCAPMAHTLFSQFIKANPSNPEWISRDRFVLSNGHGCVLQYMMLHLLGYSLTLDDLKKFRQFGSKTPGHPEANHGVKGIEVSTGPLGQGISNAVGLAMAEAHMAATFNKPGFNLIDNYTYVILGDGCLQEGVQAEAVSLAGHLKLGKLICLYDDNHISIDGDTALGFTEDVLQRFQSYGWHTLTVGNGDSDLKAIADAITQAQSVSDKPSLIKIRTTIGFGSKNQGEEKVHGAPLGAEDIKLVKTKFGFNPEQHFHVPAEVYAHYKSFAEKGARAEEAWNTMFASYAKEFPDLAAQLTRRLNKQLPENLLSLFPTYKPTDPAIATRKLSETVLNKIADALPELMGGSADLTGSNLTRWKSAVDFQPDGSGIGQYSGRYIRFGVREHGMAALCNGLAAYGAIIPFGSTFLNFISYALGSVRLSALSKHHVLYIMTHDSIGLGEDGPTHQPIETVAGLRATPNILNFRPADGNEVSASYIQALSHQDRPSVIILTRQNLPHLAGSSIEAASKGAYTVLKEKGDGNKPAVIIAATGSEVSIAVDAAGLLAAKGVDARVVSMPCWELFDAQDMAYKASVFPEGVPVVSVEALAVFGWNKYAHATVGMTTFGASAPYKTLYTHFGLDPEHVAAKAEKLVQYYASKNTTPEWKIQLNEL